MYYVAGIGVQLLLLWSMAHSASADDRSVAFEANRQIGLGINLGNALETKSGLKLRSGYFEAIKAAGFKSVRIPIRWSAHAQKEPPYAVDAAFFERVDWAIDQALRRGLRAII